MARTRDQLIRKALQKLEVVAGDEPVSAADSARIDDMINPMLDDLSSRGVWDNGHPDEYDDAVYPWLAECLAGMCLADYGRAMDQMALAKIAFAESRLLAQSQAAYVSYPVVTDYI
jgi:hypothetical protein